MQKSVRFGIAFFLGIGLLAPAAAQQIVLKVHHFLAASSSAQVNLIQPWCDKVARESGDRLKCQIYPSMQLGGTPAQLIDQARDGLADIVWSLPTYAAGRFTRSEVFELPFIARTARGSSRALWEFVQKNALEEFKGTHLILMHVHDGAVFFFSRKQPRTLDELKGLKIRAATRINSQLLAALGASPVQMPLPAVPESMSKNVIDGAMVPWEGMPSVKLQEIAKFSLESTEGAPKISNSIFAFAMNQAKYDALPPDLKRVIDANSGAAVSAEIGERAFDRMIEPNRKLSLAQGNAAATLSPAELQRWMKASARVEEDWIKEVNAKGVDGKKLLEQARALVNQYDR